MGYKSTTNGVRDPSSYSNIRHFRKLGLWGILRVKLVHVRVGGIHLGESHHSKATGANRYISSHLGTLLARTDSAGPVQ